MQRVFVFGDKRVTDDSPSFVIAEVGHNHQGNLERCKAIFHAAAEAGADAVKIQKRDNRTLFTREMYDCSLRQRERLRADLRHASRVAGIRRGAVSRAQDLLRQARHPVLLDGVRHASADFLAELDVPGYKIASGDLTNTPLLRKVAALGKPIIVSTGGATMDDVQRAYDAIMPINTNLCIMQCTSGYPPPHEELNLRVIETFRRAFPDIVIGFSSHDTGIAMPLIGYMLGARVFEKHFTLEPRLEGHGPGVLAGARRPRRVVRDLDRARIALGDGVKTPYPSETSPLNKMVKRVVAARELPAGTVLAADDLAFRIPVSAKITAAALRPFEAERLVGHRLTRSVSAARRSITLADVGIG